MSRKQRVLEEVKKYLDDKGELNLSYLRAVNRSLYSKISMTFDGIHDFKKEVEPIVCYYETKEKRKDKDWDKHFIIGIEAKSMRNQLAFEKLKELRESCSLEEIGERYNCTRQAVHHLYEKLSKLY